MLPDFEMMIMPLHHLVTPQWLPPSSSDQVELNYVPQTRVSVCWTQVHINVSDSTEAIIDTDRRHQNSEHSDMDTVEKENNLGENGKILIT